MARRWWRRFVPFPKKKTLQRWFPHFETRKSVALIIQSKADVVLDVGANEGQYGQKLRACGYRGRIVSFEPLPDVHKVLSRTAAGDAAWSVHPPSAVGADAGQLTVHHYKDSSLSSALKPTQGRADVAAFRPVGSIEVSVDRLDDLAATYLGKDDKVFVKIDVQGLEPEVIAGADALLKRAVGVQIELPLRQVYDGESSYLDLLARLDQYGLRAVYFFPVVLKRRLVPEDQMDAVLLRR
ncbi:MAG: FkbM family methyltransferase [Pseudomonadota bacterium]